MPSLRATLSRVSTRAAAPSEMELALAAVIVPSLAKAGLRVGILAGSAFSGCSSLSITVESLRSVTVTGVISRANAPLSVAARALVSEPMA